MQVTFARPFTASWDSLWLSELPLYLRAFPQPVPRICQFSREQQWIAQPHRYPPHDWTQPACQHPVPAPQASQNMQVLPEAGSVVKLLVFFVSCPVRGLLSPPYPIATPPMLRTFPGLLLECGSYINKLSRNIFSHRECSLNWGLPHWLCVVVFLSFVLGVRQCGAFCLFHRQLPQHPLCPSCPPMDST